MRLFSFDLVGSILAERRQMNVAVIPVTQQANVAVIPVTQQAEDQ
jgi:hypothetical protein